MSALAIPMEASAPGEAPRKSRASRPHLQLVTQDYTPKSNTVTSTVTRHGKVRRPQPRQTQTVRTQVAAPRNNAATPVRYALAGSVFVVLLSIVVGLGVIIGTILSGSTATSTVVVQPGDSLWSVAQATGSENISDTVAEIAELNNLQESTLHAGQELLVPAN